MKRDSEAETTADRRQLIQGSTVGAGIVLALALFALVNYLAMRHYQRFDWTSSRLYSLSEKSLSVARGIDREIDMVIFLSSASELYDAAGELLSRYAAANPEFIRKREVDPAKNLLQAQRLVEQYGIERENVVVIATEDDRRVIDELQLAEYDYSGAQFGQPPKLTEFKGEQLITSALLALVEARKPRVLFTTGHGEARLERGDQRSLSLAKDFLEGDGFEIDEWSSLGKGEVPADTDLLVIAGPTTNFLPPELDVLSSYVDAGGRLMMMLDPVFAAGAGGMVDLGFTEWLISYGIEIRDDIVIDPTSELPFFGPETIFTDSYGSHPVVEALERQRTRVLLPLARSVSKSDPVPEGFEVTELVRTSEAGWGETNLQNLEQEVAPDDEDVQGPVTLGIAVSFEIPAAGGSADDVGVENSEDAEIREKAELPEEIAELAGEGQDEDGEDQDEDTKEARMVVFGDLDLATDLQVANASNKVLVLNAFNWLVEREELIDVEARRPEQTRLSLSQGEMAQIYLLVLAVMPGLAVAFGVWVYIRRRR